MVYGSNTTTYTYDAMSRLATVGNSNSSAAYSRVSGSSLLSSIAVTYNAVQALNTAKTYDNTDRLLSTISTFNSQTISRTYTYDASNRRTQATLEDSSKWNYTYDNMSQVLSGIKSGGTTGATYAYTYDDIGNFKTERRNGSDYIYTANNLNQYTSRTFPGVAKISGRAATDATVYIQKGSDRPMKVSLVNGEFERTFKFDNSTSAINQLFKIYAVKPGTTDLVKMKEQTVNIPQSPATLTYDPDGNIVSDGRFLYSWNADNRLIKVEQTDSQKTENTFDYMGRRITKKVYNWVSGAWSLQSHIRFVYDGWLLVGEINGETSAITKIYTWGEDLSGGLNGAGGVGGLLSVTDSSGTYYPIYNGKDIIAYVDGSGTVVLKCEYDPFGKPVSVTGTKSRDFNYLFSTKYYDWETGLYYHEERFYSPVLARFLSRDPIEEEGGFNLCNYTGNNPVNRWDRLGLWTEPKRYSSETWANTCAEKGDTIEKLATKISLDTEDAFGENGWLRDKEGNALNDKKIIPGKTYSVPNVVYVDFGKPSTANYIAAGFLGAGLLFDLFWINKSATNEIVNKFKGKKYNVKSQDPASAQDMKSHLKSLGIYIYIYTGHGADKNPGTLAPNAGDIVSPGRYTPYKIKAMFLYACSSIKLPKGLITTTQPNKTPWSLNVSRTGFVVGFTEDANLLNSAETLNYVGGTSDLLPPSMNPITGKPNLSLPHDYR